MQYRGKHYLVVQGHEQGSWKWAVNLDDLTTKSGEAGSRGNALTTVILVVDSALKEAEPADMPNRFQ